MTRFFSGYFRVGRESGIIFHYILICLAAGRFAYTNGVTIFDLVSSSSFGEYYKAETFPLSNFPLFCFYSYPAPCWTLSGPCPLLEGGGVAPPPPSHPSRKPIDVAEKIKRQWRGMDEIFQMKLKNLTPGVTCDVTGQVKHKMFDISI